MHYTVTVKTRFDTLENFSGLVSYWYIVISIPFNISFLSNCSLMGTALVLASFLYVAFPTLHKESANFYT